MVWCQSLDLCISFIGGLLYIRESSPYRHPFTKRKKIHIVGPHKQLQQRTYIHTSRKRKVRVIRYYMPENMPDSWGCQLPILCVHVIMCPVLTVRFPSPPLPLSLSLPLLSEGFPLALPLRVWLITMKKPAHFSTN